MKVAMIGGTGFVGSYITDELISHNMIPRLLIREGSESKLLQPEKCEIVYGDLSHHHDRTSVPAILEVLEGWPQSIRMHGQYDWRSRSRRTALP